MTRKQCFAYIAEREQQALGKQLFRYKTMAALEHDLLREYKKLAEKKS